MSEHDGLRYKYRREGRGKTEISERSRCAHAKTTRHRYSTPAPRPLAPDAFLARLGDSPAGPSVAEPAADGAAREAAQSLWWYVVLAMAAVLLGEAWLGRTMA